MDLSSFLPLIFGGIKLVETYFASQNVTKAGPQKKAGVTAFVRAMVSPDFDLGNTIDIAVAAMKQAGLL